VVKPCSRARRRPPPSLAPHAALKRRQNVGIVPALRRIFSLQKDVRMRIDQPGSTVSFDKSITVAPAGIFRARRVRDAFDAVATNDNDLVQSRLVRLASFNVPRESTVTAPTATSLLRSHQRGEHSGEHETQNQRRCFMRSPPKSPFEIHRTAYSLAA